MTKEEQKARKVELQRARRAAMSEEEKAKVRAQDKARRDARSEEEKAKVKANRKSRYQKNKTRENAQSRAWRDGMSKEEKKEYDSANYQKHRPKKLEYSKVYRIDHLEEIAAYGQTPAGRKTRTISRWKGYGIICDDWDALYEKYLTTTHCEQCNVELTTDRYNTETTRCLDHNHDTHLFRNVLCHSCNVRRDVKRKARSAAERCRNAAGTGSSY